MIDSTFAHLSILFEDDAILAIDKPSGLPANSLASSLLSCESVLKEYRPLDVLQLIHRLDTGTSGVLLFAKNEHAFQQMREEFKQKRVQKNYFAWTEKNGVSQEKLGNLQLPLEISTPLAHHAKNTKKMISIPKGLHRHHRGKPIPAFTRIHRVDDERFMGVACYRFQLEILTGVMHQIRVHLSSIGFPLFGDALYDQTNRVGRRLGLHAHGIQFSLNGFRYEIKSPWPSRVPIWSA